MFFIKDQPEHPEVPSIPPDHDDPSPGTDRTTVAARFRAWRETLDDEDLLPIPDNERSVAE